MVRRRQVALGPPLGLTLGVALCVATTACGERKDSATTPVPKAPEPSSADAWRYAEELAAASAGLHVAPVLELSMAERGRAEVLTVTQRPGSPLPAVALEIWTFEQRGEDLAPIGEPVVLHELGTAAATPIDASDRLAELRRTRAAPGTVVLRPLGLHADDASAAFARLVALAGTVTDPGATPRERVDAAASLLRGIDDGPAFGGRLPALVGALASASTEGIAVEPLSDRRVRLEAGAETFEVWKTGSGWVLARWG